MNISTTINECEKMKIKKKIISRIISKNFSCEGFPTFYLLSLSRSSLLGSSLTLVSDDLGYLSLSFSLLSLPSLPGMNNYRFNLYIYSPALTCLYICPCLHSSSLYFYFAPCSSEDCSLCHVVALCISLWCEDFFVVCRGCT